MDDQVTGTDDAGDLLPNHIIADLNLRYPDTAGTTAFFSSITVTEHTVSVTILAAGKRRVINSPWQNKENPLDVEQTFTPGDVTPLDALVVINKLNEGDGGPTAKLLPIPPVGGPPPYYDVDGDGYATANDANIIIDYLNGLGATITPVDDTEYPDSLTPIAAISVAKPVDKHRQYALEPLYPGVGGWIVFGSGVEDTPYRGRFSGQSQSRISPRAARRFVTPPIQDLSKLYAAPLTGLVQLIAGNDIEIVGETREIPIVGTVVDPDDPGAAVVKDVIVIRLRDSSGASTTRNVLDIYRGPCSGRPESRTCTDPQPIEFINTVGPDCCGNLVLEVRGCAQLAGVQNDPSGLVIDCGQGLGDACVRQDRLPTADGVLPNEYDDLCSDYSDILPDDVEIPPEDESMEPPDDDETGTGSLTLPYLETFDDSVADDFVFYQGDISFQAIDSYYEPALAGDPIPDGTVPTGDPKVSLWAKHNQSSVCLVNATGDWSVVNKHVITSPMLMNEGFKHNATIVINFRAHDTDPAKRVWWGVEWDYDSSQLRVIYFDGSTKTTPAFVFAIPVPLLTWALLEAVVYSDPDPEYIWIEGILKSGGPAVEYAHVGPKRLHVVDTTGLVGLATNVASTTFSFIKIDHRVP